MGQGEEEGKGGGGGGGVPSNCVQACMQQLHTFAVCYGKALF